MVPQLFTSSYNLSHEVRRQFKVMRGITNYINTSMRRVEEYNTKIKLGKKDMYRCPSIRIKSSTNIVTVISSTQSSTKTLTWKRKTEII